MAEMPSVLSSWESFYVIVGSAAAVLIGLQFVVIVLIADTRMPRTEGAISAFGTPTVVHFGGALLVAAIMSAPWPSIVGAARTLVLCGLAGLLYAALVVRRARRQQGYRPVFEDWLWHAALPLLRYATIGTSALVLHATGGMPLFFVGAAALLLLFIGIHNAWDTVTYIVATTREPAEPALREPDEPMSREPAAAVSGGTETPAAR